MVFNLIAKNIPKLATLNTRVLLNKNTQFLIQNRNVAMSKTINVFFIDRNGDKQKAKAKIGTSLLDVAIDNNIDLEGACEGTLSCSTCHLILRKEDYEQLKAPNDEENDMLDLAFGLTPTSRLGCQITVTDKMDGWVFVVPKDVSDARG
ncbi:unnamed protein product [Brachionus calyciflorus]|uniref:2Fe-2S ferredoxin-type domain-containing protein n=1 Tax=Brachionus calyciflorus TaxID=104777 RepID=A0A813XMN0_9BILA|nr:unnamed protein product [Brachionus calyciflorus]